MPEKSPLFASRADLWSVLVVGAAVIVWNAVTVVREVVRLLPNRDVQVDALLSGVTLPLPVGPGGTLVPGTVDAATVTVSDMPAVVVSTALGAAVIPPLATIAIALCVLLLCRQMMSGQFFSARATRLVAATSALIAGAWLAHLGCSVMTSNWVLAQVLDPALADAATSTVPWTPVLAAMAVGALGAAFHAGERMQRDSEGLV